MDKHEIRKIEEMFDSYCKRAILNASRDIFRVEQRHREFEIALSAIDDSFIKLYINDDYQSLHNQINIGGKIIIIHDDRLYSAIQQLSEKKRNIVVLRFWFDMSDIEIANELKMPRRTVQYNRSIGINELKKLLNEGNRNDG